MKQYCSYRFELDPNNSVRTLLAKHAGAARFVYNWSLARRIERFNGQEGDERFTNAQKEHKALVALKSGELSWLYEVSKCAPQHSLRCLDTAFKRFWASRKEGVGFPKFKKKSCSRDSFHLYGQPKVSGRYVKLPRLGTIRIKELASERVTGRILSATVSREVDRWFVSFNVEKELQSPPSIIGPIVGVDLGIKTFATISTGEKLCVPDSLQKLSKRLPSLHRRLDRKLKGSKNRRKAVVALAKAYRKVRHIRLSFIHKLTTDLAKTKSVIVIEDLNIEGMLKNKYLAKSIGSQGWGELRKQLAYKTQWYGSQLIVANRFFASSKLCSNCGEKVAKLPLSIREWSCPKCGVTHDRDINAAKNLEKYPEFQGNLKPVKIPLSAERL